MKRMLIIPALFLLISGMAQAQIVSAVIGIDGLTCSMCARGTEKAMRRSGFISDMKIDLNDMVAQVTFDTTAEVSMDKLAELIDGAGFTVRSVTATINFTGVKMEGDHFVYRGAQYHFINAPSQTPVGLQTVKFVDQQFLSKKDRKAYAKKITHACYASGKTEPCCIGGGSGAQMRVYHIMLTEGKPEATK